MIVDIYNSEIKRLAAACAESNRLESAQSTASLHNPFCGDRVQLDINLEDRIVLELGYEVRGCLLCRAALGLMVRLMTGSRVENISYMATQLENLLKGSAVMAEDLEQEAQELLVFRAVQDHKSRHECVMLPFRTALKAVESFQF